MDELLAPEVVSHFRTCGIEVIHWAYGLCLPMRWPSGEVRYSAAVAEPAETEELPLLPIEPAFAPEPAEMPPPLPELVQPPPRPSLAPGQVLVKVLEKREIGGKVQYFVQEEGRPRGVLAYGVPPPADQLPQPGDEIIVYRNNNDLRNPQYRWDRPTQPHERKRGTWPPRGGRR